MQGLFLLLHWIEFTYAFPSSSQGFGTFDKKLPHWLARLNYGSEALTFYLSQELIPTYLCSNRNFLFLLERSPLFGHLLGLLYKIDKIEAKQLLQIRTLGGRLGQEEAGRTRTISTARPRPVLTPYPIEKFPSMEANPTVRLEKAIFLYSGLLLLSETNGIALQPFNSMDDQGIWDTSPSVLLKIGFMDKLRLREGESYKSKVNFVHPLPTLDRERVFEVAKIRHRVYDSTERDHPDAYGAETDRWIRFMSFPLHRYRDLSLDRALESFEQGMLRMACSEANEVLQKEVGCRLQQTRAFKVLWLWRFMKSMLGCKGLC
ncbi:hypothetical protein Tco_0940591 [Tanacetum coccineum]|uniref:Uncharacterized protein n=1 Tax=Tanacetum coccineum TaxID=301880 RepID=A0ABQ5DR25_9ASTR